MMHFDQIRTTPTMTIEMRARKPSQSMQIVALNTESIKSAQETQLAAVHSVLGQRGGGGVEGGGAVLF